MRPRKVVGLLAGFVSIEVVYAGVSSLIVDPIMLAFMASTMLFPGVLVYEVAGWYLRRRWAAFVGLIGGSVLWVAIEVNGAERVFLTYPDGYIGTDYVVISEMVVGYVLMAGVPVAAYILADVLVDSRTSAGDGRE